MNTPAATPAVPAVPAAAAPDFASPVTPPVAAPVTPPVAAPVTPPVAAPDPAVPVTPPAVTPDPAAPVTPPVAAPDPASPLDPPAAAPVVTPMTAESYVLPEAANLETYRPELAKHNFTQEQVDAAVSIFSQKLETDMAESKRERNVRLQALAAEQGEGWKAYSALARGVVEKYDTDGSLATFLKVTHGSHEPVVIKVLAAIGKDLFGEGGYSGGSSASVPAGTPKTLSSKLFPHLK